MHYPGTFGPLRAKGLFLREAGPAGLETVNDLWAGPRGATTPAGRGSRCGLSRRLRTPYGGGPLRAWGRGGARAGAGSPPPGA
ncbi:hypothetical protein GCM10010393_29410 [Streptomyces gobitricini]|uniref:Uncharacterized protein n=1 Tax=Streptomyces gobitricini TaxID=68211 RepID=A0ABP5ZI94_9ACTN